MNESQQVDFSVNKGDLISKIKSGFEKDKNAFSKAVGMPVNELDTVFQSTGGEYDDYILGLPVM